MNKGIGIAGIAGRMGRLLAQETLAAGVKLVGGVDHAPGPDGVAMFADIAALAAASDVVIDFTHASTAAAHAAVMAGAGCAWVLGGGVCAELLARRDLAAGAGRAHGRRPAGRIL